MASKKPFLELTRQGKNKRLRKLLQEQHSDNCVYSHSNAGPSLTKTVINHAFNSNTDNVMEKEFSFYNNRSSSSSNLVIQSITPNEKLPDTYTILNENPIYDSDSDVEIELQDDQINENGKMWSELKAWGVQYQITLRAFSALLSILQTHSCFKSLPSDARTICKTPRTLEVIAIDPGHYCHLGLTLSLSKLLADYFNKVKYIDLLIGIDGLPLFNSTSGEFWPILGSIINFPELQSKVFPIGIYYGHKKPANCVNFLSKFTEEITLAIKNGVTIDGKNILVRLKGICCDAPAKAFILGTKNHNEYFSCISNKKVLSLIKE